MGFYGNLLSNQLLPAQHNGGAAVMGEETVIISAALSQSLSGVIAGKTGDDGEINAVD